MLRNGHQTFLVIFKTTVKIKMFLELLVQRESLSQLVVAKEPFVGEEANEFGDFENAVTRASCCLPKKLTKPEQVLSLVNLEK